MVGLLIRKFIKDKDNTSDPEVRRKYGCVCSLCGVGINVLLFLGKFLAGLISGSIAVTADAFNNLSDAGSSVVTLIGFRLASQQPDKDHPFGHGRFEYISGMLVSVVIILMGAELFKSGVNKILNPASVDASPLVIAILAVSVLFKLYMAYYNGKYGKKIDSPSMKATATDSLSDCAATGAVLAAALIDSFTAFNADGWAGAIVAVLIVFAGIGSLRETISPLLGQAPSRQLVDRIYSIVMAYNEARGVHDLVVHDYGPGRKMISLHVEVDGSGDIYELHDAIDNMERELSQTLRCDAVIHMDPIAVDDRQTYTMKGEITRILKEEISPDISIHDLRIVPGVTHTNLIFDTVILPEMSGEAKEIKQRVERAVSESFENCYAVTKIDIALNG